MALFFAIGGSSFAADAVNSATKLITGKTVKDSSLTGKDVKNSSLTTSDVKNGSLLAADFKAGQLPAGGQGPEGAQGPQGLKGDTGPRGAEGASGADGADGADGTSVTSANEAAGTNCANGGSKFTSASGNTFACNGAKGDKGDPGATNVGVHRSGGHGAGAGFAVGALINIDQTASCPVGQRVTGGGFKTTGSVVFVDAVQDGPEPVPPNHFSPPTVPTQWRVAGKMKITSSESGGSIAAYVICAAP